MIQDPVTSNDAGSEMQHARMATHLGRQEVDVGPPEQDPLGTAHSHAGMHAKNMAMRTHVFKSERGFRWSVQ